MHRSSGCPDLVDEGVEVRTILQDLAWAVELRADGVQLLRDADTAAAIAETTRTGTREFRYLPSTTLPSVRPASDRSRSPIEASQSTLSFGSRCRLIDQISRMKKPIVLTIASAATAVGISSSPTSRPPV